MINRLLVANRAEIASRVFRTCRDLGIATVAVHSDPDADLPYVREADLAVRLPGAAPADTYLRGDLLVAAALESGADAVHPGYGFLSENAGFARQVVAAGLTWIGPSPQSMEQMGSKVQAKKIMAAAGVPVLEAPGTPTAADLPLLVKASAGGGGRGMRVVRDFAALDAEVAAARAEAESAFGDGTVFVEPYVEGARHVEVQVWGDAEGRVSVLGDRDCSVQRRHQKVVEEAPAPGIPDEVRAALHDAARTAAEAIDYVGAGTVELLYDQPRQRFFFLEMNTRLQVEHPVTEAVTGLDLVALQIRAAEGGTGTVDVGEPHGHAIEARLYAEDPATGWTPQSGRLDAFDVPRRPGLRVDAGFDAGNLVSTHYDAMLAKVVAHAPSREQAARRLAGALADARLHGVRTNRDLLVAVLRDDSFLAGRLGTDLLDHVRLDDGPAAVALEQSAFAAAVFLAEQGRAARAVQRGVPAGWRNVRSAPHRTEFAEVTVAWERRGAAYVSGPWSATLSGGGVALTTSRPDNSVHVPFRVHVYGERVDVESVLGHVTLTRTPRFTDPADEVASGSLLAPMPGSVVAVAVAAGQDVAAGEPVLVLEAMKMQHTVRAPYAGVVTEVAVTPGDQVAAGAVLAVVEEQADD